MDMIFSILDMIITYVILNIGLLIGYLSSSINKIYNFFIDVYEYIFNIDTIYFVDDDKNLDI